VLLKDGRHSAANSSEMITIIELLLPGKLQEVQI
jgi:hypothetical protein